MPEKYLLQVHSHPVRVPHSTWSQWYTEEHIRDMVHFGAAKTAAFYKATSNVVRSPASDDDSLALTRIPSATAPDGNDFKGFLALYQTDRKHCLEYEEYTDHVRSTSELWDQASSCHDVGSFAPVDMELVEPLNQMGGDEDPPAHIIHTKITGSNVEDWIHRGHGNAASNLSGYRRSLVYRPLAAHVSPSQVNGDGVVAPETENIAQPYIVILHEFDAAGHGKGLEKVKDALDAIEGSQSFSIALRAYELVASQGFGGRCRRPERLE